MKYEILGGGHVEAASTLEIVEALREIDLAWIHSVGIEDFMENMAEGCKIQTGALVRTDSVEHFLHDLEAGGFITPVA